MVSVHTNGVHLSVHKGVPFTASVSASKAAKLFNYKQCVNALIKSFSKAQTYHKQTLGMRRVRLLNFKWVTESS